VESDVPVAVMIGSRIPGVYVPIHFKVAQSGDLDELRAAADRLMESLSDVDEEQIVVEFKLLRHRGKSI
jgi:hypothetical protein